MGQAYLSTVEKFLRWSQANSLWFFSTGGGCCADEVLEAVGCRYDLERFGCVAQSEPEHADLLVVKGLVAYKAAADLQAIYRKMRTPKYVMAIGACACGGGLFGPRSSYSVVPRIEKILPVDVFVPGCPPRPEAIMNGLLSLQERIRGSRRNQIEA